MKMDPHISPFFPLLHREKNNTFLLFYFLLKVLKIRVLVSSKNSTVISTQDDSSFLHGNVLKLVSNVRSCSFQHENSLKLVWTV